MQRRWAYQTWPEGRQWSHLAHTPGRYSASLPSFQCPVQQFRPQHERHAPAFACLIPVMRQHLSSCHFPSRQCGLDCKAPSCKSTVRYICTSNKKTRMAAHQLCFCVCNTGKTAEGYACAMSKDNCASCQQANWKLPTCFKLNSLVSKGQMYLCMSIIQCELHGRTRLRKSLLLHDVEFVVPFTR